MRGDTLVLIDDDEGEQMLFKRAAAKRAPEVTVRGFATPSEAVQWIIENVSRVLVVVTDLKLGPRTGLDVLAKIKENPRTAHVPVVVISGAADPEAIEKAHTLCSAGFFQRPFDLSGTYDLVDLIVRYWSHSEAVRPQ